MPMDDIAPLGVEGTFVSSFKEGYQTMDAIAAILTFILATVLTKSTK